MYMYNEIKALPSVNTRAIKTMYQSNINTVIVSILGSGYCCFVVYQIIISKYEMATIMKRMKWTSSE